MKFRTHRLSPTQGELALHSNLMPCVIIGRTRPVLIANDTSELQADIVCISPEVPHRVLFGKGGAHVVYFDGIKLPDTMAKFSKLDPSWRELPAAFDLCDASALDRFRNRLQGEGAPPDPVVMGVVERIYANPFLRVSQTELATSLGLERTQALRHFKAATGQTFRKFKTWAALIAAAHSAFKGEPIGLAGIGAGFSDAAHVSRKVRETFGLTPTKGVSTLTDIQTI